MRTFQDKLYIGTMDWSYLALPGLLPASAQSLPTSQGVSGNALVDLPITIPDVSSLYGADVWSIGSATSPAVPESTTGLGNSMNYGIRTMTGDSNEMYMGTANPMNLSAVGGWELVRVGQAPPAVEAATSESTVARPALSLVSRFATRFAAGSSTLTQTGEKAIVKLVRKSGKDASYTITGVATSITGLPDSYVKALATIRAEKVKAYLIKLGVKKANIKTKVRVADEGVTPETKVSAKYLTN
jgi:outer membrane protein OmpA-like peptidoglycan-associated protein